MDARVTALESEMRETRTLLARIDERMKGLATKDDISSLAIETRNSISSLAIETRASISALAIATKDSISSLTIETKASISSLALETKGDISSLAERVAKVEGAVERLPTTLQLVGFIIAIFTAAGILKYFGH
jgi:hypothetical protein